MSQRAKGRKYRALPSSKTFSVQSGEETFEFNVRKLSKSSHGIWRTRIWKIDLKERTISGATQKYAAKLISSLSRSYWDKSLLTITFRLGDHKMKDPERTYELSFEKQSERDKFYLLCYALANDRNIVKQVYEAPRIPDSEDVGIFAVTWNLGEAAPPESLQAMAPPINTKTGQLPELLAYGVQECQYAARRPYASCEADWFAALEKELGSNYTLIQKVNLWEMRLGVFVRSDRLFDVSAVEADTRATGAGRVLGNKGGIGISLSFLDTRYSFVSAHLAANTEKIRQRNDHAGSIVTHLQLGERGVDAMSQSHYVFFLGDLNYRIEMEYNTAVLSITQKKWDKLLGRDQLTHERTRRRVFFSPDELEYRKQGKEASIEGPFPVQAKDSPEDKGSEENGRALDQLSLEETAKPRVLLNEGSGRKDNKDSLKFYKEQEESSKRVTLADAMETAVSSERGGALDYRGSTSSATEEGRSAESPRSSVDDSLAVTLEKEHDLDGLTAPWTASSKEEGESEGEHSDNRSGMSGKIAAPTDENKRREALLSLRDGCIRPFFEGPLRFPPTYRYNRGNREYGVEKWRTPSCGMKGLTWEISKDGSNSLWNE